MKSLLPWTAALALLGGGCHEPNDETAPPELQTAETKGNPEEPFIHMTDNALLADMTVSDIHFLPHRAALNSLGEQRLRRLATLMEQYGGTIRFDTGLTDKKLIEVRTEKVIAFLASTGLDTTREIVKQDLPGGHGMDANEVILIKIHEATYTPGKSGGGSNGASGTSSGLLKGSGSGN